MSPEGLATLQEAGKVFGTAAAAGWLAWRARGRKDKPTVYTGPPDDHPRKITRKEWHDVSGLAQDNNLAIVKLKSDYDRLDKAVAVIQASDVWEGFARLEEQFQAHVKAWEAAGRRAETDRAEVILRLGQLSAQISDAFLGRSGSSGPNGQAR